MECFIFELHNLNLFPLTTKPLNIFEPALIQMIQDSIAQNKPWVLCFKNESKDFSSSVIPSHSSSEEYYKIAGYGYPQIIERRPNGAVLIFVTGQGKVKLDFSTRKQIEPGIDVITCEPVIENSEVKKELMGVYVKLKEILFSWIQKHITDEQQKQIFIKSLVSPQEVINALSAYLVKDYDLQYELFQILDINDQIYFLNRLSFSNELAA